jgi:hypothetical protein
MNLKHIIKEEIEDFDWVGDVEPMEPGMEFLKDNFGNLQKVIKDDEVYYVDEEQKPIFMHYQNSASRFLYVNYVRIWFILEKDFGLKTSEIEDLVKEWLDETYNLSEFIPIIRIY